MNIENNQRKTKVIKIFKKNDNYKNNENNENNENNVIDINEIKIVFEQLLFNVSNEILNKINNLETRIINMEKKLDIVLPLINDDICIEHLKELKQENLDVEKVEVLKALNYRDYRSVIYIFRHCYKNKLNEKYSYPIKITGKRSYEYYFNNKWNPDLYGYHSMNTICLNIQNLFINFNDINYIDIEDFILNQKFIYKLSEDKYKKDIFKNIIEEVRINNF